MIEPNHAFGEASAAFQRLTENVATVIAGNDDAVRTAAICMFADGNLLLEGVPGVGKTTLARALAASIGGAFTRIQATPDLLPSDLTGVSVFDQVTGAFPAPSSPTSSWSTRSIEPRPGRNPPCSNRWRSAR